MTSNISLFTYSVAAIGFTLLSVLLITQWRVRPLGPALVFAASATGVWASVVAVGTLYPYPPITLIQLAELARNSGWLFFLLQLLGFQADGDVWTWLGRRWLPLFSLGTGASLGIIALRPLTDKLGINGTYAGDAALVLWLAIAIVGLLLVEQIYRNANGGERWGVKFLCLSLGAVFAYDFFMYAEALLFLKLDARLWQARGLVNALIVPWLLLAVARNRNWRMDVHVSRHVVFHTVTLIGAGLYLLSMAVIGYFIKYLGGSWGGVLQVSFLAFTAVLLLTLLFSNDLRARLRVLLSKHFFSYRYDYREEWLRFTEGLAGLEANNTPQGVVRALANVSLSKSGVIFYRMGDGVPLSQVSWNMDLLKIADWGNLQEWITQTGWVIDVPEWRASPQLYDGLSLPQPLHEDQSVWLIVPLMFQHQLEGLLFLARTDLKTSVNWEDRDLLKTAGRQAAALLAQQRVSRGLVEARQFDAFNRLSAYVIHDLKNILAQQSLMVTNAKKHRDNPAFIDDMISTVDNSVKRMQRLMDQMRSGMRDASPASVQLNTLLDRVVKARSDNLPKPVLKVESSATITADRERLATVFGHLLQNAQEATNDGGDVCVTLSTNATMASVLISDTGCGMSEEFILERLFKPFESTKGLTGMGIGAFESREYVRQLGGDITVTSKPGEGSRFTVTLPVANEEELSITNSESCEPDTLAFPGGVAH